MLAWLRAAWLRRQPRSTEKRLPSGARLPVVPTPFGLAFAACLLVMFIWSVNYRINLGYGLTFLVSTVGLLSAGLTVGYFARLRVHAADAEPVWAGESAWFTVMVEERDGQARPGLWLANAHANVWCDGIDAGTTTAVSLAQPVDRRGWQEMEPIQLHTTLPLGLFVTWQWLRLEARVLVYPRIAGECPLPKTSGSAAQEQVKGESGADEFSTLATYQPGETLSRVAWKQSVRGEMQIKRFAGGGGAQVSLDYHQITGDVETRLSQLAKWIVQCEGEGRRYALKLPGVSVDFGLGGAHRGRCLRLLAEF